MLLIHTRVLQRTILITIQRQTTTSMHLCLHSPDILRNICEQAYEGGYDPDCRAVVAAFSTTCHSIHRVAVKVLWSRLFSLRALVKCMPTELWLEDRQDDQDLKDTVVRGFS